MRRSTREYPSSKRQVGEAARSASDATRFSLGNRTGLGQSRAGRILQRFVDDPNPIEFNLGGYVCSNQLLGEGGFGKVFKCMEKETEQLYAIKAIKVSSQMEADILSREIAMLDKISGSEGEKCHPFITCLHEIFQMDDYYFLVLDFFDGYELFDVVEFITLAETKRVMTLVAEAVLALHQAGVCHRDLKHENIMFNREAMKISVIDLGLSCADDCIETRYSGTKAYMPPEVLVSTTTSGFPSSFEMCTKGDVYSLGVMLYEMMHNETFSGQGDDAPYTQGQIEDMKAEIREHNREPGFYLPSYLYQPGNLEIAELGGGGEPGEAKLWKDLSEIVEKATEANYRDRISVEQMLEMLKGAGSPPVPVPVRRTTRTNLKRKGNVKY